MNEQTREPKNLLRNAERIQQFRISEFTSREAKLRLKKWFQSWKMSKETLKCYWSRKNLKSRQVFFNVKKIEKNHKTFPLCNLLHVADGKMSENWRHDTCHAGQITHDKSPSHPFISFESQWLTRYIFTFDKSAPFRTCGQVNENKQFN